MGYNTGHVATIFNVTTETVRNWTVGFSEYLSPTALPGRNKKRTYTFDDMKVLSLVAELKSQGMTNADIHAALQNGQRGVPPALEPDEVQAIVSGDRENRLSLEIERMQQALVQSQEALKKAQQDLARLRKVEDENIRLQTQLEISRIQEEKLETRVKELEAKLEDRVKELSQQIGREYARGVLDALREKGELPKED
jgi:DNA-binding transcriptional MerR regulator